MLHILGFVAIVALIYLIFVPSGKWPGGPKGLPFLGVSLDRTLPLHEQLAKLVPKYGDFFTLNLGNSKMVVLSSPTAVEDLIVKKGNKYSSRPSSSPQVKIITQWRIVQMEYGDDFRRHRKLIHSLLGVQNAKTFLPYQEYESRQSAKNLIENPDAFWAEVYRYSSSVTFSLLLGARFERTDANIPIQIGKKAEHMFRSISPGYWLSDRIPFTKYLPDALAPWRAQAHQIFDGIVEFWGVFFDVMHDRIKNGSAPDCFLKRFLESSDVDKFSDIEKRIITSELLSSGADTTASTLRWFFRAAILYPDFILRAQEELDRVIGPDRLPVWEDRKNLPYLAALLEELQRWGSTSGLAFFHATSEPDTYRGYSIPAKTTVTYNTYAIHHNQQYYPDPEKFLPERFLPETHPQFIANGASPKTQYGFGVGRRECPGRHVAEASLYIVISRLLWTFNFSSNDPQKIWGPMPIVGPRQFECKVTPRSAARAKLILSEASKKDDSLQVEDASYFEPYLEKVVLKQSAQG